MDTCTRVASEAFKNNRIHRIEWHDDEQIGTLLLPVPLYLDNTLVDTRDPKVAHELVKRAYTITEAEITLAYVSLPDFCDDPVSNPEYEAFSTGDRRDEIVHAVRNVFYPESAAQVVRRDGYSVIAWGIDVLNMSPIDYFFCILQGLACIGFFDKLALSSPSTSSYFFEGTS